MGSRMEKKGDGVGDGSGVGVGKRGSVIGEWDGVVDWIGWRRHGRVNSGTSLQINCLFFLSGYCHERGAEEGALAVALAWLRRGGVAVKDVVDGGGGAEVEVAFAAAAIGVWRW